MPPDAAKTSNYNTAAQVAAFNANVVKASRRAGNRYLDGCEKIVEEVIALKRNLADKSQSETIKTLTATGVDVTRQITSSYTTAARALIS